MRYLLDTSVWLRGVNEVQTLPPAALAMLQTPRERFGLAAISLWEIGKKHQRGKLRLPKELAAWLAEALAQNIELLPITPEVVIEAMELPEFPTHDPADELIVATARVHRLILITSDTRLKSYRHARIHYFKPILRNA